MLSKTSGTSRGRRGSFFRDERCEFSFTATFLSFERETTLTADHIGHCRDSLLSNHSTIAGYVPPALERRGNPRDFFVKTGNDRGRRILLPAASRSFFHGWHSPCVHSFDFKKQSNGSKNHISMHLSHFWLYDLLVEQGIARYRLMYGHTYRNAK